MTRSFAVLAVAGILVLAACAKKESADAPKANPEPPAAAQSGGAPHAVNYAQKACAKISISKHSDVPRFAFKSSPKWGSERPTVSSRVVFA